MRSTRGFAAAAATAGLIGFLLLSPAAAAQGAYEAGKGSWTVRGFGAWLDTDEFTRRAQSVDPLPPVGSSKLTVGNGDGMGLALEYRVTRRLGVEALALQADLEGEFRLVLTDPPIPEQILREDVETDLYGLGVNFHLTAGRRMDLYVGPVVARIRYGDFQGSVNLGDVIGTTRASFSDELAYGATLGVDLALGRSGRWALSGALRQLWSDPEDDLETFELELNPLVASAGVAFRFGG